MLILITIIKIRFRVKLTKDWANKISNVAMSDSKTWIVNNQTLYCGKRQINCIRILRRFKSMWFRRRVKWVVLSINNSRNKKLIYNYSSIIHTLEETPGLKTAAVSIKCSRVMVWPSRMRVISSQGSISWCKMVVVTKALIRIIRRQLMLTWVQDLFKCTHTTWLANNNFLKTPSAKEAFQENSDFKAERNQEVARI